MAHVSYTDSKQPRRGSQDNNGKHTTVTRMRSTQLPGRMKKRLRQIDHGLLSVIGNQKGDLHNNGDTSGGNGDSGIIVCIHIACVSV